MFDNDTSRYKSYTGYPMKANDIANPCGVIAKAFFNGIHDSRFEKIL